MHARASSLVLAFGAALSAGGCRAFEPTLPQRAHARQPPRDQLEPQVAGGAAPRVWSTPVPEVPDKPALPARASLGCDETIRLELRGVTLAEALHTLGTHAKVNLLLDAELEQPIDVSFPAIKVDDALNVLLEQNGLRLVQPQPGVFAVARCDGSQRAERRFQLRSARVVDLDQNLKALVGGGTQLVLDAEQNFVFVRGPQSEIDAVERYLDLADRVKLQVLIEMRIAEVRLDSNFELGLEHTLSNLEVGNSTYTVAQKLATSTDAFQIDLDGEKGDLKSTLDMLEQYVGLELLSSPRVVAVNNTQSAIEIVREVPYIKSTAQTTVGGTNGAGTSTVQEVEFKEVGLKLKVKPIIRQGGVIELDVDQELSEVASFLLGVPAVDRRKLTSRLEVRDGNTLVVGGLMQDHTTQTDKGVPGLFDMPFLGRLFRSDVDEGQKRELLVFLTPRILSVGEEQGVSEAYRQVYRERRGEMGLDPLPPSGAQQH